MNNIYVCAAALLTWSSIAWAQVPGPGVNNEIDINPGAPTGGCELQLAPQASAGLTIKVDDTGTANNAQYELKSGPTFTIRGSGGNAVVWTPIGSPTSYPPPAPGASGGTMFKFMVVNTAKVENASTTVEVKCVWGPKRGTGSGGRGGTTPPDIAGLATAIASLPSFGSCIWSFDRTNQVADGVNVITYTVTAVNEAGSPVPATFTKVESRFVSAGPAWGITPASGASPLVGMIASSTSSTGSLTASYTENGIPKTSDYVGFLCFWELKHTVRQLAKSNNKSDRAKLGLSEEVDLSLSPAIGIVGKWSIVQGQGGLSSNSDVASTFTAPPTQQIVSVGVEVNGKQSVAFFNVVAPTDIVATGTVTYESQIHTDFDFNTQARIEIEYQPTDVSFYRVHHYEGAAPPVATGDQLGDNSWNVLDHDANGPKDIPANNTFEDTVGLSKHLAVARNWPNGSWTWSIPQSYQAEGGELVKGWMNAPMVCTTTPMPNSECKVEITKYGLKKPLTNFK